MNESTPFAPIILLAVVGIFTLIGLIFGGMLAFDVTVTRFSNFNFKSLLSMLFLALLVLIGIALVSLFMSR